MADRSAIEWTDATWNPVRGCSRVSPGCGGPNHEGGCYAEKIAARFSDPGQPFHGFAERTAHGGRWTGKLALIEDHLTLPLRWRRPRRIFVNSMSDLFHENLPDEAIDKVFAVMALCPQHTFQVLTKRPELMLAYFTAPHPAGNVAAWQSRVAAAIGALIPERTDASRESRERVIKGPLPNVWLGVSTEDQPRADERIPLLRATPAAIRFISAEPLLGPIDLTTITVDGDSEMNALTPTRWEDEIEQWRGSDPDWEEQFMDWHGLAEMPQPGPMYRGLDWVIAGGESGPNARPMHPDWARSLRDQCAAAKVPFFFKQWGEWYPEPLVGAANGCFIGDRFTTDIPWNPGGHPEGARCMARVGKKAAGRLLDGKEHSEFPA